MTRTRSPRRGGFTLVELLVAMALAIVLMALVVGVAGSDAFGSYKVVRSGDRVSGWLLIAKSRAIRDGQARGVRFFRNAAGTFTEARYIEVPDAWVPNPLQEANPTGGRIVFSYNNMTSATPDTKCYYVAADYTGFNVAAGDVLTLPELGGAFRLTAAPTTVNVNLGGTNTAARQLPLASFPNLGAAHSAFGAAPATPQGTLTTYKFAFGGAPRPLFGEPALLIPDGTAIELSLSQTPPLDTKGTAALGDDTFDVMFNPSGQSVSTNNIVVLWIRDTERGLWPAANAGEQALVSVYNTGQIATHPAGPGGNPYQYVRDGLYTGGL